MKWYDKLLEALGLMTIKRHKIRLEEMDREYAKSMLAYTEFLEASDEKLIEENESAALRIENYKNEVDAANSWIDTYRRELFDLMVKCWDTEDPTLTAYCDQLESKYFDYDYMPGEEDASSEEE